MTKKSTERANADVGFMMTAYNLRRIINILGIDRLRKYLEDRLGLFFSKIIVWELKLAHMLAFLGKIEYWKARFVLHSKRLYLMHISPSNGSF